MALRKRFSTGLTLVELLVVVVVLALLATMAAPAYNDLLSARRLSGTASLLIADLQNARSEALLCNTSVTVEFSTTGYTVKSNCPDPNQPHTATSPRPALPPRSVAFPEGVLASAGANAVVTYDSVRGTATTLNTNAVTLAKFPHSLKITVHSLGRVECTVLSGSASC